MAPVAIPIETEGDIVTARQRGRAIAAEMGFRATDQTLIATAISEIARNIVSYAVRGEIVIDVLRTASRTGIRVVATDEGPGIPDLDLAFRDGYSTGNSLGMGLPGARRLMDELEVQSTPGVGTTVTMKKWIV